MTSLLLPLSSARSLVPPVIIFGVTPHYYMMSQCLRMLKFFIPSSVYEYLDGYMYHSYQSLVTYFFEVFSGTQVYFYGDSLSEECNGNVLYLSNHQSAIDWSLVNFVAIRQKALGQIRYIMKPLLKYLPFFGPYFVQRGCIFVQKGQPDHKLRKELKMFMESRKMGYWIVIFPEGTRFSSKKIRQIKRSVEISNIQDVPPFKHVLFPKTKAIELSLQELNNLDFVYDLTIAFKTPWLPVIANQEGPSLLEFVSVYGREVHMHFKKIPVKEIPRNVEEQRKWVYSLFQEKDKLLSHFYHPESEGRFPEIPYQVPLQHHQTLPYAVCYTSLLIATLSTEWGRKWYLRSWMFGFGSLFYMPLLNWLGS